MKQVKEQGKNKMLKRDCKDTERLRQETSVSIHYYILFNIEGQRGEEFRGSSR